MTISGPAWPSSSPPIAAGERGRLLQVLGAGFGVAVAVGNTIGAGIFRAPGEVAGHLPDPMLFLAAWIAGGAYAWLGALQMAELGTMLPRSGGQYVFSRHALGDYAGFVVGWSDWLSTCGSAAAVALVVAELTGLLVPALEAHQIAVAGGVTTAFTVLQWRGIRRGSVVQHVTTSLKAAAFLVLIVAALAFGQASMAESAGPPPPSGVALATAFVLALQAIVYTYDGWTGPVYFSEEVRHPGTAIPRALFSGVALIVAIYLLVNVSLLHVLPVSRLAAEDFAPGAVANAIAGPRGEMLLRVLMLVSMLSAIHAYHLMASRVLFALSRDGLFSPRAAVVNEGGTPTAALALGAAATLVFIVFGRTFGQVITVLAFFFIANYTLSFVSLVLLRRREPERPRPYRAWGYPWTTAAALLASVAFLAGAIVGDTARSVLALAVLGLSYPVFRMARRRRRA
jgi:basic amino acid/polyamine antiporter, APA family